MKESLQTLIFGYGYLGSVVGRLLREQGDTVLATTRSAERAAHLLQTGVQPIVTDWTDRRTLDRMKKVIRQVDRILVAVSYDSRSRFSRYESQVGGFRNFLSIAPLDIPICYISTTGVYHQTDGSWVDERSPTHPKREGGKVHLEAESLLHRYRPDSPWTVLRLAGIYGPGRVPRIDNIIEGRAIASPSDGYLNLIHVEDAAAAVLRSWQQPKFRMYVVSDDEPMVRGDFYREIARQLRAPEPKFESPASDSSKVSRSETNKRLWNRRVKADLLSVLKYPTYREGLRSILAK